MSPGRHLPPFQGRVVLVVGGGGGTVDMEMVMGTLSPLFPLIGMVMGRSFRPWMPRLV